MKEYVVRILGPTGVRGAGYLVTDTHVLSCAHVVASALGVPETQPNPPDAAVELDFPLVAPGDRVQAKAIKWYPVASHTETALYEDIVLLELAGPAPAGTSPAPLASPADLWAHPFRALGFPGGFDPGQYATGVIRAERADKWVQIEDTESAGYFVTPGYSGTPVWDETEQRVVGMIVGASRNEAARTAYMIPTHVLAAACAPYIPTATAETALVGPRVLKVANAPVMPDADQIGDDEEATEHLQAYWLQQWFESAKIIVNLGQDDGVEAGDYFDVLYKHEPVEVDGEIIGYDDESGVLVRAAQVQARIAICTIESWGYKTFFEHVVPERLAGLGLSGSDEMDVNIYNDVMSPVVPGQPVARIPSDEKDARDEVEDLYGKSLDDGLPKDERDRAYREMVRRADRFLLKFPDGYFADNVLYHKGYAQFQLAQYDNAIDTYELYLRRYPFSSAEGARGYVDKAKEALRQDASS